MTARRSASSPAVRFSAARQVLRRGRRGGTGSYTAYITVMVVALYAPLAWGTVTAVGRSATAALSGTDPWSTLLLATAVLGLAAAALARQMGVLSTSGAEVELFLHGQFPLRLVFRRRMIKAVVLAAAVGAAIGIALITSAVVEPGLAASSLMLVGAGTLGAVAGMVVVLASVSGHGEHRQQSLLLGVLGVVVFAAVVAVGWSPPLPVLIVAALLVAVAVMAVAGTVLDAVDPDALLVRQSRWRNVGASVLAGNQRAASLHLQQRASYRAGDLSTRWAGSGLILSRDLVGLQRTGSRTLTSFLVAIIAIALLASGSTNGSWSIIGALMLFTATNSWTMGLAAHVDNAGGSGLTPHSPARMLWWHLQTPVLVAVAAAVVGSFVALVLGANYASVGIAAANALVAVSTRVWVLTQPLLPPVLLSPQLTPAGDLSGFGVAAWFMRGWLVTATAAFASVTILESNQNLGQPLLVLLPFLAVVSLLTFRQARSWP